MAIYEVTCITTQPCTASSHIAQVGLKGADGTHRVGVEVVRLMLAAKDNLYTVSPTSGAKADVRKGKCACGFKTITSVAASVSDNDVGGLPSCA